MHRKPVEGVTAALRRVGVFRLSGLSKFCYHRRWRRRRGLIHKFRRRSRFDREFPSCAWMAARRGLGRGRAELCRPPAMELHADLRQDDRTVCGQANRAIAANGAGHPPCRTRARRHLLSDPLLDAGEIHTTWFFTSCVCTIASGRPERKPIPTSPSRRSSTPLHRFRTESVEFPQKLSVSAAHVGGHADLTVTNIHRPFMQKRAK